MVRFKVECKFNFFSNKMELHQKIHHLFYNLLRKQFAIIGHDIFRDEDRFKPYLATYFAYAWFSIGTLGVINTFANYGMADKLNCLGFFGVFFEVKSYIIK